MSPALQDLRNVEQQLVVVLERCDPLFNGPYHAGLRGSVAATLEPEAEHGG
jgi:hypothetical protein